MVQAVSTPLVGAFDRIELSKTAVALSDAAGEADPQWLALAARMQEVVGRVSAGLEERKRLGAVDAEAEMAELHADPLVHFCEVLLEELVVGASMRVNARARNLHELLAVALSEDVAEVTV